MVPVIVRILTKKDCVYCEILLENLQNNIDRYPMVMINPIEVTALTLEEHEALMEKYGAIPFPSVLIGNQLIKGPLEVSELMDQIMNLVISQQATTTQEESTYFSYYMRSVRISVHLATKVIETCGQSSPLFVIVERPRFFLRVLSQVLEQCSMDFPIFIISDFRRTTHFDPNSKFWIAPNDLKKLFPANYKLYLAHYPSPNFWAFSTLFSYVQAVQSGIYFHGKTLWKQSLVKLELLSFYRQTLKNSKRIGQNGRILQKKFPLDVFDALFDEI